MTTATAVNGHSHAALPESAVALASNMSDGLPLLPAHRRELMEGSGLTAETIAKAGIYSATDPKQLAKILGRRTWDRRLGSAIVFPFFDGNGQPVLSRVKPDRPAPSKSGKSPAKYLQPSGVRVRVYVPPKARGALATPGAIVIVTEGEKKSLAASQAGFPCIGLVGVWAWKDPGNRKDPAALSPELERIDWKVRLVLIAFDSDAASNPKVCQAERALAATLVARGAVVKIIRIPPGPAGAKMGVDDFLVANGAAEFQKLIDAAAPPEAPDPKQLIEFISNGEESEIETPEGPVTKIDPLKMPDVIDGVVSITGGFPKRIGRSLFVHDSHGTCWLDKPPALFGWLGQFRPVKWHRPAGFVTKEELFSELQRTAESFDAIEEFPHEPPLPRHFYTCGTVEPGDGEALDRLIGYFRPDTAADRQLIRAMVVTPGWGGRPGSWPAFVITSESGRGAGKTKLAEFISYLWGGMIDVSPHEGIDALKSRLLSSEALTRRIALIDNAKVGVLSWGNLEALMTAHTISGKRLYHGEATRPNTLTWIITLNGPALSADLAQRSIIIRLARGENYATWSQDVVAFIDGNRQRILADCIGLLRREPVELARYTRWAAWEAAILSRLDDPSEVQRVIIERQRASDADSDEMGLVEDYVHDQLAKLRYDPERQSIRIPTAIVARWYGWATGDHAKVAGVSRRLKQAADEGQLHHLEPDPSRTYGRCFIWTGQFCDQAERTQNDLESRIAEIAKSKDG